MSDDMTVCATVRGCRSVIITIIVFYDSFSNLHSSLQKVQ